MSLYESIMDDLKVAMKARDQERLNTLRLLKSAIGYAVIEKYGQDGTPSDEDILAVVRKEVKKRNDGIAGYEEAGRAESAEQEKREKAILEGYLPTPLSDSELETIVQEAVKEVGATSKKEMGAVMKAAMAKSENRADGKALSSAVARALS